MKNGVFKAGLHPDEMEDLAQSGEDGRAIKCSTRDLPLIASSYYRRMHGINTETSEDTRWGGVYYLLLLNCSCRILYSIPQSMIVVEIKATTVAATMRLAHKSGITTFVTGEALREVIRFSLCGILSFY